MIYVSSACVKYDKISDSVRELAKSGFKSIELSGGTCYYEGFEDDLLSLKEEFDLEYLIHNYFPPQKEDIILNLASLNDDIYQKTLEHFHEAIALTKMLGIGKFGLHAGFFIDFPVAEAGKKVSFQPLKDESKAIERFCEGFKNMSQEAGGVELYIENNVLSVTNAEVFKGENPFMLTDCNSLEDLERILDFKLLLDVAHLRVSANALNLDFEQELNFMMKKTDYIHLSENDGTHDQNDFICEGSDLLETLNRFDLTDKIITLESYGNISKLKNSYEILKNHLKN